VEIHPELGEMLVASVEIKPDAQITRKVLRAACNEVLSTYKVPRQYRISIATKREG
jgi:acyl-CoA synthetase (AMP-forming)/AMP-acid ligase II